MTSEMESNKGGSVGGSGRVSVSEKKKLALQASCRPSGIRHGRMKYVLLRDHSKETECRGGGGVNSNTT